MTKTFPQILSELRRSRRLSQRQAAADLNISQALLSHYENGTREPGLAFVCRVCDYYGVSADYLLGRTDGQDNSGNTAATARAFFSQLRSVLDQAEMALDGLE